MASGILLLTDGTVSQVGELDSLQPLINLMRRLIPQLEAQEIDRLKSSLTEEQLQELLSKIRKT